MALRFRGLDAPIEVVYWKGGKAPVPDPATSINAQASANRYNIVGPSGSQTWSTDPNGQATQTVSLNPAEQKQYDLQNQIADQLLTGNQQHIKDLTDTPFQYDESGFESSPYTTDTSGLGKGDFSFDQATPAAAKALYDQQIALLQPQFERSDKDFEQGLANQGIPMGSEAYNEAMTQHENNKNFALTQASQAATQLGSQLALSQRQQNQTEGGQMASLGLTQRQQRETEATQKANMSLTQRQQRIAEIAQALGSSQIAPVQSYGTTGQPIDVSGAYNAQNQANLANYNAGVTQQNQIIGGLAGLGSAYIGSRTPTRPSAAGGEAAASGATQTYNAPPSNYAGYSSSAPDITDTAGGTTTYFGGPDDGLDYVTPSVSRIPTGSPTSSPTGSNFNLGTIGKAAGGAVDAYNLYGGLKEGGLKGAGSALAAGSSLASLAGAGGAGTTTLGAIGNLASGNYVGAAKNAYDLYKGYTGATAAAGGGAAGSAGAGSSLAGAGGAAGGGAATAGTWSGALAPVVWGAANTLGDIKEFNSPLYELQALEKQTHLDTSTLRPPGLPTNIKDALNSSDQGLRSLAQQQITSMLTTGKWLPVPDNVKPPARAPAAKHAQG